METTQKYTVPQPYEERRRLRSLIHRFVSALPWAPPLSVDDLSGLSDRLIREHGLDASIKGWLMVEIHNSAWHETVASIPRDKRLLLLPKCLSHSGQCEAEIDDLGLLCHRCRRCTIPDLQEYADSLGTMSMVAEGFTSVIGLIENRVVDAVIGVGCLDSLEKAFPLLIDHAVPGLAIPLNRAGCKDTEADEEYVRQLTGMQSDTKANLLDYDYVKSTVQGWFTPENLAALLPPAGDQTSVVAQEWLSGDGKRWRPYLLASVYMAITGEKEIPPEIQRAAVAVECFHKASLVHDDLQDRDATRYGKQTVHAAHGDAVAINVGDLLLGEGYRLLATCGNMELLQVAAEAHIALCKGQGMELEWSARPQPFTLNFVLEIFRNKTVPAFDVALTLGAICAGADAELQTTLHRYSQAIGIAYQLQDDLEDFDTDQPQDDPKNPDTEPPQTIRPSAVLAALCEQHPAEAIAQTLLRYRVNPARDQELNDAIEQVRQLTGQYHQEALATLHHIKHVELKRLLFRVTRRILKKQAVETIKSLV
ncbi:MAG: polyprenyl synthetase family protein [Culturomica sp.]|jgi:geranylgeranyl pyrophosphate synthase|nr:polyprenyl synthetase family protein [Culturomica sp.]